LALTDDLKVSRTHAELQLRDGQWILIDLGSSNGSKVNKRRIEQHPLRDGDLIQLGRTTIVYVGGDDPNATEADTVTRAKLPDLSGRERQVLTLIARGLTDREIGDELFISASTVRSHLDRIGEKTGLRRRAELTRLAVELGMVD
jgi:DNA-binding CsgD family transcriptional regulator